MKRTYLLLCLSFLQVVQGVNPRLKFGMNSTYYQYNQSELDTMPYASSIDTGLQRTDRNFSRVDGLNRAIQALTLYKNKIDGGLFFSCITTYWLLNVNALIHELGHASMAKLFGYRVKEIRLDPIKIKGRSGTNTSIELPNNISYHDIYISAAGPFASFLFGSSLLYYAYISRHNTKTDYAIPFGAGVGILINVVENLIPNGSNDGQNILDAWRAIKNK